MTSVTEEGESYGESIPLLPHDNKKDTDEVSNGNGNSTYCATTANSSKHDIEFNPASINNNCNAAEANKTNFIVPASSWIRLCLFFAASIFTGGIIPGQNIYIRLFCEEAGLFSYACGDRDSDGDINGVDDGGSCCPAQWLLLANTMNALSVCIYFFFLVAGLIFDSIGGQWAAVLGCFVNASGFLILAVLLFTLQQDYDSISPITETIIFCIAVILVDAGSICTNISFFSFLWHLPSHQALVLSLANCCLSVAALIPLVLRSILHRYWSVLSLPIVVGMYVGAIIVVAMPLCWVVVPSIDEYRSNAMNVLGVPIPHKSVRGIRGAIKNATAAVRIMQHHTHLHIYTMGACVFAWLSSFVYMVFADPLGQEVFLGNGNGNSTGIIIDNRDINGEKMATLYNQCSGALGLFVGPLIGVLVDRFPRPTDGIIDLGFIMIILLTVIAVFCGVANWTAQLFNVASAALCQIIVLLFINRYAIIFAPPNRIGSFSGILVAGLGAISFFPILVVSLVIAVGGSYVRPTVIACITGATIWVSYVVYVKRTNPLPDSPVFLPEDEREIAKTFAVGTLEDAAYVSGKTPQEFRRLSSSSNVLDQRTLLDAAFTYEAGERIMSVARRRSSTEISIRHGIASQDFGPLRTYELTVMDENEPPQYPIPVYLASGCARGQENFVIQRGKAATALETIEIAFNGHGGFGGSKEPLIDWMLSPIGPPDDPRRKAAVHSIFGPLLTCAESYGTILEVRVKGVTAASCLCYHPEGLENGAIMEVGSDRYYYSLTVSGAAPIYMNRDLCGPQTIQRFVGLMQDIQWDTKRKEYGPMWYIGCVGVHPNYQGRGYGKKLINIVAAWADRDCMDCYLECSEVNIPFYVKCGYKNIWRGDVTIEGSKVSNFVMVRKHQGQE